LRCVNRPPIDPFRQRTCCTEPARLARLGAQRETIALARREIAGAAGVILEFGLGKGRAFDHLRQCFPERDIFVFNRVIEAYGDCVPPPERLFLGEFRDTALPALAPLWTAMMREGGVLASDRLSAVRVSIFSTCLERRTD
jgi:hypothetical protein